MPGQPEAVVVGAVRTPLGRRNGALAGVRPDELLAFTLRALVRRTEVPREAVEDVIAGCVNGIGEQGRNIARVAALAAGLPVHVPGVTVNRMCGSSQQALHMATHAVLANQQAVVIAAGVESMSRVPLGADAQGVQPPRSLTDRYEPVGQGAAADAIARRWGISRSELDTFAAGSHVRAAQAWADGRFADECVPVPADVTGALLAGDLAHEDAGDGGDGEDADPDPLLTRDEGIRPSTTVEVLAGLTPAFGADGLHHAGNSSQITDGAAAVLICSSDEAARLGLRPTARVVATQVVGVDPQLMLHGVIPVTQRILARTGLGIDDIDLFEVNEAFASVPLAWLAETGADPQRTNVNGGAIALGHPTGCSGARIATTLVYELARRHARFGLQVMCIGHGMATATLFERWDEEKS